MSVRKAEVIYIGDAASIVRAAREAEAAQGRLAASAKKTGQEIAAANKTAADSATASAEKQSVAHRKAAASVSGVGSAMTKMTAPILLAAGAGAKFAIDFQSQMQRVHTQAGVTEAGVRQLSKAVFDMSGKVAQSPQALADGIYHVASSLNSTLPAATRYSTEIKVLKVAAEGATVGHANLVDVTNALDAAIVSGLKGVHNYSQAMGALNKIVGAGDMNMQDLADALGTGLLGPMRTFGISLTEVGGALAVFGDNNIRGQEAATKLNSAIRIMAAPSKAAAKELAGVGLSTLSMANDMRKGGIVLALQDLKKHLTDAGLTASQQGLVIARAFGGRQSTGVQLLLAQLDRLKAKTAEVGSGAQGFGAAWAATQNTAAFKTRAALDRMKADLTQFGSAVLPPLLKVGTEITGDIDKVAQAFASLPRDAQRAIITGGLIVAGIGPALKILSVFTGGITKLYEIAKLTSALIAGTRTLGGLGGATGAAGGAASVAPAAASSAGLLRGVLSKGVAGLGLGGLGVAVSQVVASGFHGGTKDAIATIGTDTSIGAGLGAFFGPAGVAGGAIIGGLVGSFTHFILNDAEHSGREFANKFLAPLPAAIAKKFAKPLADATKNAANAQPVATPNQFHDGTLPISATQFNQYFNALYKQGQVAGKSFIAGFSTVKIKTIPAFISDAVLQLDRLRGTARNEAASTMVSYALSLEQHGKLPKGATDQIIASIETRYRSLAPFLNSQGRINSAAIKATMKWDSAVSNLTAAESQIRSMFGLWRTDPNINGKNVIKTYKSELGQLEGIAKNTTGAAHKAALIEINALKTDSHKVLGKMVADFQTQTGQMSDTLAKGPHNKRWADSVGQAMKNFSHFTAGVGTLMAGGAVTTTQGADAIYKAVVSMMKSFGGKPPNAPQLGVASVAANVIAASAQAVGGVGKLFGAAGGMMQFGRAGDKGHDNIPVRFGGTDIAVGSGEVGLVLNHAQQSVANAELTGGIPGLFQRTAGSKHYMAGGGWVRTGATIDPTQGQAPTFSAHGGFSFAELLEAGTNAGLRPDITQLLGLPRGANGMPMETAIDIRMPGSKRSFQIWKNDVGSGQAGNSHFTVDLHQAIASALGWGGNADVEIARAGTDPNASVSSMGGGVAAALKKIAVPKVRGAGTVADAVRAGLSKLTASANAFVQAHAPKAPVGGGAGFSGSVASGFGGHSGYVFPFPKGISYSWQRIDQGQDLEATPGAPIVAIAPGVVSQASDRFGGFGPFYPTEQIDSGPLTGRGVYYGHTKMVKSGHVNAGDVIGVTQSKADTWTAAPAGWLELGFLPYGSMSAGNAIAPILHAIAGGKYAGGGRVAGLPFVGSFMDGGIVPRTGMALVHQGEKVIPAAKGFLSKGSNSYLTAAAAFLYPIDAALAALAAKIQSLTNGGAPTHDKEIAKLTAELDKIRREKINPPQAHNQKEIAGLEGQLAGIRRQRIDAPHGKKGAAERKRLDEETLAIETKIKDLKGADSTSVTARRKALANETLTIEEKIKKLKADDKAAKANVATEIKNLNVQSKNLTQLQAYTDAITNLRTQVKDLASQAASAWRTIQEGKINATHDAAIKSIAGGGASTMLAAMQKQDAIDQNAATLAGLNKTLTDAQTLAAHSGGQTHLDALQQVKDAQTAIDAFNRQVTEQQLQDSITAATQKADDAQTVALAGMDRQTADYQAGLDKQFGALTTELNKRKITYATFAKDVNAILDQYGLAVPTDATTEATVTTGPGPLGTKAKPKWKVTHGGDKRAKVKHHRASGGPVQPGYVYRVGEEGPEDVVFGQRGTVLNASQTRRGGSGMGVHIEKAYFTGTQAARAFADRLAFRAAVGTA